MRVFILNVCWDPRKSQTNQRGTWECLHTVRSATDYNLSIWPVLQACRLQYQYPGNRQMIIGERPLYYVLISHRTNVGLPTEKVRQSSLHFEVHVPAYFRTDEHLNLLALTSEVREKLISRRWVWSQALINNITWSAACIYIMLTVPVRITTTTDLWFE